MLRIVELFAGVGGFRLAFDKSAGQFRTVWANQWEPGKKVQHAFDCYVKNFGGESNCTNNDIAIEKINVPNHDLLVGGFPCQDYSVARTSAQGIEGKKGVLWWEIRDIVEDKRPEFVLLENVDRLVKSPAKQRGRDFGIILRCFHDLGYNVEWRVVNAADYGHPQKRRRVFIFASRKDSRVAKFYQNNHQHVIYFDGLFARAFPVENEFVHLLVDVPYDISADSFQDLPMLSKEFEFVFENSGVMINGKIMTRRVTPRFEGIIKTLGDVLVSGEVDEKYFLGESLEKWQYLKGSKKELRTKPNGEDYYYTEGSIPFPDNLSSPSRTMLTSEASTNRSSHVVVDCVTGKLRLLTPTECERLNEFPDGWTNTGMPESARYFVMGNALVVGVVTSIADTLHDMITC